MWSTWIAPLLVDHRDANPREMSGSGLPQNQMQGVLPALRLGADGKQQRHTGAVVEQTPSLCL